MRVVFFGSPVFAVPSLKAINASEHKITGAISQPDKPRGRKLKETPTPVKEEAKRLGIKVLTPTTLDDDHFIEKYKSLEPQVNVVIAYGRIIPGWLINYPSHGTINAHASLLPRWRGAAPIRRAIMASDTTTGVTIQYVSEKLDAGDIALQEVIEINSKDNNDSLAEKLSILSAKMLVESLDLIKIAKLPKIRQEEADVTYAEKITKEEQRIDFNSSATELHNKIRGLALRPGAYTLFKSKRLKILQAKAVDVCAKNGQIIDIREEGILIGAANGSILATKVQMEGSKPMAAYEFAKGHHLKIGDSLI